ncbi:MAG: methyltransferase domain-containing protein [Actinomycetota bacterium]|nr:methyltransferase domain-containing protein [Actinomycetota bacterium]
MTDYALRLGATEIARYQMMAERARASEANLWHTAGINTGATVADIGCGPGAMTALLAEESGPTGCVVAVDNDPEAVTLARAAMKAAGHAHVDIRVGEADSTGLSEGNFDVVMLRHVLAHNGGREQSIVNHVASLARPGGTVYLVDVDLTMTRMVPTDSDLDDLFERYTQFHRHKGNDPQIGLKLTQLAEAAGLELVTYQGRVDPVTAQPGLRPPPWAARHAMLAAGIATDADLERGQAAFSRFDLHPARPLLFPSIFTALAVRR